ncbi:cytochrome P450 [Melanogaster broomeanus]|nr:cytochrome P450 [Melanogaster broomeanus]
MTQSNWDNKLANFLMSETCHPSHHYRCLHYSRCPTVRPEWPFTRTAPARTRDGDRELDGVVSQRWSASNWSMSDVDEATRKRHFPRIHCLQVPHPLPIVGNVHGINAKAPWLTYSEWSKVYGDLVHSRLFSQDIIIINSRISKNLLEDCLSIVPTGRTSPPLHFIMKSVYDYNPLSANDYVMDIIGRGFKLVTDIVTPEVAVILGAFPISTSQIGGSSYHPVRMVFDALQKVDEEGAAPGWLQGIKEAAATAFAAGSETSSYVLTTFLLAMVLHPEVHDKAHPQINAVVGKDRLPTLDDRSSPTLSTLSCVQP